MSLFLYIKYNKPTKKKRQKNDKNNKKNNKTCKLIDMTVPSDRNTSFKTTEKLSKYKNLVIETTRMWGVKIEIISVVVSALGLIRKGQEGIEKRMKIIPGAIDINELQKIT